VPGQAPLLGWSSYLSASAWAPPWRWAPGARQPAPGGGPRFRPERTLTPPGAPAGWRDLSRIHTRQRKATRSLTLAECRAWLAQLDADGDARDKDLPDLCRFMIGTGVRVGEALAVAWPEVDSPEDCSRPPR